MYSNQENINIICTILKEQDIRYLVISPGGTNIPLIKAVQDDSFFTCYSVIDERSAAYVAIGIYLQKRKTVALICTSAQATRNYIPGLTEAFYKKVPILAITMEKHPRYKYQEYMQAPDQTSLPKDSVKKSFELPFISDINDFYHSIRVTNEAILELTKNENGPVQLSVPWLDFPLKDVRPSIRSIKRYNVRDISQDDLTSKRILLVIGEHLPFSENEKKILTDFAKRTNTCIYVNHLSNFSNEYTIEANLLLLTSNDEEINEIKPDIMITIGGQTGDYPFFLAFSKNNIDNIEHWRICRDGCVVDTYDKLTRIYQGEISEFFDCVKSSCDEHSYYRTWYEKIRKKNVNLNVPFSNVAVAQFMHDKIPPKSIIQFSILNSLRIWNWYSLHPTIECYSNVGAFGIDGGMSTLIGQSMVTDKMCFMIVGDLAFFYDMNCLGIREVKNNVRIMLINNNGGIEFKLNGENKKEYDRFIAAANYHGNAKGWAESCGFKYYSVCNIEELEKYGSEFLSESDKPILLEVFVSDVDESEAYLKIVNNNRIKTVKDNVKTTIKNVVGEKKFDKLKQTIKGRKGEY